MSTNRIAVLCLLLAFIAQTRAFAADTLAPPPVLATGIYQAGLLADGRLLCLDFDDVFTVLDLSTGKAQPWQPAWSPTQDGWDTQGGGGFGWKMALSTDGKHVAMATSVGVTQKDPDGDYIQQTVAIVLSGPDGTDARCVALADLSDGGPQLDFTQDSARLVGPWFFACPPTPDGYRKYVANDYKDPSVVQFNYIDCATGRGALQENLPDFEFYTKAADSDFVVYEDLDEPGFKFVSLTDPKKPATYLPPDGNATSFYEWVLPDAMLINLEDGAQQLVSVDGSIKLVLKPLWHCYVTLPDGTCLFSDDRGKSVKYGKVDWPTTTVDWWVERPDLARFAEPLGEMSWPSPINKWVPLRDSSGVVIIAPEEGDVFFVQLSRAGAKP
jgi:hypothetical protein